MVSSPFPNLSKMYTGNNDGRTLLAYRNLSVFFNPNRMPSDEEIQAEQKRQEEIRINNLHPVAQLEVRLLQYFMKHQNEQFLPSEVIPLLNIIKDALNYPVSTLSSGSTLSQYIPQRVAQIFEGQYYTPDKFLSGLIRSMGHIPSFDKNQSISGRVLGLWIWEHLALDVWTEVPVDKYIPAYIPEDLVSFFQAELYKKSPIVLL